jgi:hypothetical protein
MFCHLDILKSKIYISGICLLIVARIIVKITHKSLHLHQFQSCAVYWNDYYLAILSHTQVLLGLVFSNFFSCFGEWKLSSSLSGFLTKIFYTFLIFPISASCTDHLILLYLIILIINISWISEIMKLVHFYPGSCYYPPS